MSRAPPVRRRASAISAARVGRLELPGPGGVAGPAFLLPSQDMALALLEFDTDRVVAALINVLDRVRALRFHPADAHGGRGSGVLWGLKLHRAAHVIPDPGRLVDDHHARRPVRVLWFAGSRLDHHLQHPDSVVSRRTRCEAGAASSASIVSGHDQGCSVVMVPSMSSERPLVPAGSKPGRKARAPGRKGMPYDACVGRVRAERRGDWATRGLQRLIYLTSTPVGTHARSPRRFWFRS